MPFRVEFVQRFVVSTTSITRSLHYSCRTGAARTATSGARWRSARRRSSGASTGCAATGRCAGSRRSSTTPALGHATEALVELFYAPGTQLDEVARTLSALPEVVEAWSVTGEADAIARVRTRDNADLERLIIDLQRDGHVVRTRSQVVMSRLVAR
jgi:DNA-binding Lrp family transcriptional regulator